jgi:predicted DNA-binding transcriptional regulator AlpA
MEAIHKQIERLPNGEQRLVSRGEINAAPQNAIENLLNEHEVARITGLSVASVRRWRLLRHGGPKYLKIGASVRYKPADVADWLDSRPVRGEAA